MTLVTIIITTYNRSNLLSRAIESAINQTYENLEIIIVDDNSTDDTQRVIKKYIDKDLRIVNIKNIKQSGANFSRNEGILKAKGSFIAGLDDDDEFMPTRIARFIDEYDANFAFITSLNILKDRMNIEYSKASSITTLQEIYTENITNQIFVKKQRLIDAGLFDLKLTAYQDYDMWIRLMLKYGSIKVVQEYLQIVHVDNNRKRITTDIRKRFSGYFNFYKKYRNIFPIEVRKDKLFMLYRIRNKPLSKDTLLKLWTHSNKDEIFLYYEISLKSSYVILQRFYNFILNIDKNKEYIIYGYGSLGKMLLPHLKNNIIGIIDITLKEKHLFNIPILSIEDLKKYKKANVIITPIKYETEILSNIKKFDINIIKIIL